jgi:hypothetical protein
MVIEWFLLCFEVQNVSLIRDAGRAPCSGLTHKSMDCDEDDLSPSLDERITINDHRHDDDEQQQNPIAAIIVGMLDDNDAADPRWRLGRPGLAARILRGGHGGRIRDECRSSGRGVPTVVDDPSRRRHDDGRRQQQLCRILR